MSRSEARSIMLYMSNRAIAILAPGLRAEAISKDGVIEAVSKDGQFFLGVQWHPEWAFAENPQSKAIFAAFGQAVRHFAENQ